MQNENGNHFNLLEPNLGKFLSTGKSVSKQNSRRKVKVPPRADADQQGLEQKLEVEKHVAD